MGTLLMEGWSGTTVHESSQEAVERGGTIGSFLFPGWSFTFDADKWAPDRRSRYGAGGEQHLSWELLDFSLGVPAGNPPLPFYLCLVCFPSLDVIALLLLARSPMCGRYANVL